MDRTPNLRSTATTRNRKTASSVERALVGYAAKALDSLVPAGWTVELIDEPVTSASRADGVIALTDAAGERVRVWVEAKTRPTPSTLSSWAEAVADRAPWLIVAPELSDRSKAVLREAGVNWIDATGSASLRLPRVLLEINSPEARRRAQQLVAVGSSLVMPYTVEASDSKFVSELFAGDALRIVRRLMLDPSREWRVKDMAEATGVSKGWVSRVFSTLERDAFLAGPPRGPRRLVDRDGLLEAWADAEEPPRAEVRAVTTESDERLRQRLAGLPQDVYALTADAAADLVAPFARVSLTELYIRPDVMPLDEALKTLGARETSRGANLVLLPTDDAGVLDGSEAVKSPAGPLQIVSRPQLYVDLRRRSGQSEEAADFLRDRGAIWPPTS